MAVTQARPGVDQEQAELWTKSYEGEVFGEAYFEVVAAHTPEPDRRAKLEALATLERCTKEMLAVPMGRHGLPTDPDPNVLDAISAVTDFDYHQLLEAVRPLAAEYLGYYRRLRELVAPEDEAVADALIAHELALELFAWRELSEESDASLDPVRALSHVTL